MSIAYGAIVQLPDLNLLPALDALLRTESVSEAAEAMHVSPSAMSRTLRRLRRVMGDPLLVPSGRGLALTPRALSLRASVEAATAGALAALQPPQPTDIASISRRFVIRANDAMAVVLGGALTARAATQAPGIRLRIVPEGEELPTELRDRVDLDVGVQPELPHDVRSQPLSEHRYAAVARADAPFAGEPLTVERFAALPHLTVSRRGGNAAWSTSCWPSWATGAPCWPPCQRRARRVSWPASWTRSPWSPSRSPGGQPGRCPWPYWRSRWTCPRTASKWPGTCAQTPTRPTAGSEQPCSNSPAPPPPKPDSVPSAR